MHMRPCWAITYIINSTFCPKAQLSALLFLKFRGYEKSKHLGSSHLPQVLPPFCLQLRWWNSSGRMPASVWVGSSAIAKNTSARRQGRMAQCQWRACCVFVRVGPKSMWCTSCRQVIRKGSHASSCSQMQRRAQCVYVLVLRTSLAQSEGGRATPKHTYQLGSRLAQ